MRSENKRIPEPSHNKAPTPQSQPRHPGTTRDGGEFPEETVKEVWMKSKRIPDFTHGEWATDVCGERIRFSYYGTAPSQFAWEIDHVVPVDQGGTDEIENLQPLQWENNRKKGNLHPWKCVNQGVRG